jgi:outer membrane protein OmpA-like peptidoglycan-associated protein
MKRTLLVISIMIVCFAQNLKAQLATSTKVVVAEQYLKKANEAYDKKDYSTALDYYLIVLNDGPKRVPLYWKTAESAFNTHRVNIAGKYYEALAATDSAKTYNLLNWRRALVKKMEGNYDEAMSLLKTYQAGQLIANTEGRDFTKDIQAEMESCEWAKTIAAEQPKFVATALDKNINTDLTDIAAVQYGNTLYYTTAYLAANKKPVTQVFNSDFKEKSRLSPINIPKDSIFTAGYSLNTEGSRVYFNVCEQDENHAFHCDIYYRDKFPDDRWDTPHKLSETVNMPTYTASNPSIGRDKTTGKDVLYFASDRPGGKGKLDIWHVGLDATGEAIGVAENLSAINTPKDDITPYFFNEGQILFFSSEGHKTLGGLDVFYVEKIGKDAWTAVNNAGQPINSSFDDTYFSVNGDKGLGYFSTNRKGKTCSDTEKDCVCNDIFNYEIKADIKVEIFAKTNKENLIGCRLQLIDIESGEVVQTVMNATANDFNFPVDLNKKYRLIASKAQHVSDTVDFDTKGIWQSKSLYQKLELVAFPKLTVYVLDEIDHKPLDGAKVDIWEIGSHKRVASEILRGAIFTWDKLEFGKSYRITAHKDTYDPDTNSIFIANYTPRAENKLDYVDTLYLLPFRGLPLVLYFDNDHPNPNTRDTVTFLTYGETFAAYTTKEEEYLSFIYKNADFKKKPKSKKDNKSTILPSSFPDFSNADPISAAQASAVSAFFNDKIRANYTRLVDFSGRMKRYLAKGQTLEIVIEGYASPLAENEYNRYLTSRRIMSIYNHFYQYDGGALRAYLLNNQLRIRVLPYGEEKAERTVSDDARDRKRSVYSVEAMKERKVEIKEINLLNDTIRSLSYELKQFLDTKELLSFLDNRLGVESRLTKKIIPAPYAKTGVMAGNDIAAKGEKTLIRKNTTGKQPIEMVLLDAYTGEIIGKNGFVDIVDAEGNNLVGKAKRKGDNYHYDIPLDKNLTIKSHVAGYNQVSKGSSAFYTEGGEMKMDTVFLTPFSGLPLSLYFDNDRPDPNTQKAKTTLSYDKSYQSYYAQMPTYVKKYNDILKKKGSVPSAIHEIEQFFNNDVKQGFETLDGYAYIIKSYMEQGLSIEVVIEGYASPLANASYNEYLTQRRINSVVNFFSTYGGGNLTPYVKNGHLTLKVRPLGETQAAFNVSDDSHDPQNSIYGLGASRERRVVIKDILIKR